MTRTSNIEKNSINVNFPLRNGRSRISPSLSSKYVQLCALLAAYVMSNVFRTLPAIMAPGISKDYSLSIQSVGYFLAAFNFSFGAMQLFVGVAIDRFGPVRTVATLFIFACVGSVLSCFATSFVFLMIGQALIGVGCSAVFLGCLVFLSKHFEAKSFAALSGLALGLGGLGMLLTATPLAMLVEAWSWRGALLVITVAAIIVTISCFFLAEASTKSEPQSETFLHSFESLGSLMMRRGTLGILVMGSVGYAAMITVRGFWIGPLLAERQELSLVQSGNAILILSLGMTISPLLFGWIDPGERRRRHLIVASALTMSAAIYWLGISSSATLPQTIMAIIVIGAVSGFTILQYADARSSFEPAVLGRALSLLNMSVFIGAAIVQLIAGSVSERAAALGANSIEYVFCSLSLLVFLGCVGLCAMPMPRRLRASNEATSR